MKKRKAAIQKLPRGLVADRVTELPATQLEKLVSDAAAAWIFNMSKDAANSGQMVAALLGSLQSILKTWDEKVRPDVNDKYHHFLRACCAVVQCALNDETKRPSVDTARWARKVVIGTSKEDALPSSEFAKDMCEHPVGKDLMKYALTHAKAGVEDAAATNGFEASVAKFESILDPVFEDFGNWIEKGHQGKQMDILGCAGYLEACQTMAVSCQQASTISNMCALLHAANYIYVDTVRVLIGGLMLESAESARADGNRCDRSPDGQSAEGVDGDQALHDGGDESSIKSFKTKSFLYGHVRDIDGRVRAINPKLTSFVDIFFTSALNAQKLYKLAASRVGSSWHEHFDQDMSAELAMKHFNHNVSVCEKIVTYMMNLHTLSFPDWWLDDSNDQQPRAIDEKVLCAFSKIHHEQVYVKPLTVIVSSTSLPFPQGVDDVAKLFGLFCQHVGQHMYDMHTSAFLQKNVAAIADKEVCLGQVRETVLTDCDATLAYSHLLPKVDATKLVNETGADFKGTETDNRLLSGLSHNQAFKHLQDFAKAVALTRIEIPGMHNLTVDAKEPCIESCFFALELKCAVADVVAMASAAQVHIIMRSSSEGQNGLTKAVVCEDAVNIGKALQSALVELDSLVNASKAVDFEKTGWVFTVPIATMRSWHLLAASFWKRCEDVMLKTMAMFLAAESGKLATATPTWTACFSDDGYNEHMAQGMFKGRLDILVKQHNQVHAYLSDFATAAGKLSICPRMQEHSITSEAVAVAAESMKQSSIASIVTHGVDLLCTFRHRPEGPQKATDFLAKHEAGNPTIPSQFWQQFKDLESHAVAPVDATANAGGSTARMSAKVAAQVTPVKRAVSESSLATPGPKSGAAGSSSGSEAAKTKAPSVAAPSSSKFKRAKRA
ncbi:unnamed protein product [Prorocentrum cordatum]|uniref:Uncharacterized protein n=1 Tax=Prorocentrum cordatum TaxID=2364126 RepID=A0ABN9WFV0_9DINO|nr:unnamed protein product [Polarella glacialis]